MRAPVQLIAQGVHVLPCIGDGRQSGTSGSPSILNASPEAAVGGGLAVLKTGDRIRVDLRKGEVNVLLLRSGNTEAPRSSLTPPAAIRYPASQTPWQEMQRGIVGQMDTRLRSRTGREVSAYRAHQGYSPPQSLDRRGAVE